MIVHLTSLLIFATATAQAESRLAVIRPAADFTLTTQDGQSIRLADQQGKVLLVSFVFTTCNGSCPATTHRMGQVQQEAKSRGLFKDNRVRLLSITLDPAKDKPEVLRNYMRLYDVDPASWTFLTGPVETVQKTIAAWGMWVKPVANGQLDHPSRVFLVDKRARVREIYNLDYFKAPWVCDDIQLLLDEAEQAKSGSVDQGR